MKMNRMMKWPASAGLPENLTAWFSERTLLSIVLDAVLTVELPPAKTGYTDDRALRPKTMLTLLTYCYATDLVSSEDMVRSLRENPAVRYICALPAISNLRFQISNWRSRPARRWPGHLRRL